MSEAGIVLGDACVCVCVSVSVRPQTERLLIIKFLWHLALIFDFFGNYVRIFDKKIAYNMTMQFYRPMAPYLMQLVLWAE